MFFTLNDIVKWYNDTYDAEEMSSFQILHPKRLLISHFHEFHNCLAVMKRVCRQVGLLSEDFQLALKPLELNYRAALKKIGIGVVKEVRNYTFHPKLFFESDKLLQYFRAVGDVDIDSLENLLRAGEKVGFAISEQLQTVAGMMWTDSPDSIKL